MVIWANSAANASIWTRRWQASTSIHWCLAIGMLGHAWLGDKLVSLGLEKDMNGARAQKSRKTHLVAFKSRSSTRDKETNQGAVISASKAGGGSKTGRNGRKAMVQGSQSPGKLIAPKVRCRRLIGLRPAGRLSGAYVRCDVTLGTEKKKSERITRRQFRLKDNSSVWKIIPEEYGEGMEASKREYGHMGSCSQTGCETGFV
ncbi:hypothetical protein C8J56DRAFT_886764 [Mycena floridula]|nr:hypothetical protein C8J56DRAFT_886764 [Mycena floridula]